MAVKFVYGIEYWTERLISVGNEIEPEKYTDAHKEKVRSYWKDKAITDLISLFVYRNNELNALLYK